MKGLRTGTVFDLLATLIVFKHLIIILSVVLTLIATAFAQGTPSPVSVSFDFRNGSLGWEAGFADYPPATDNGSY